MASVIDGVDRRTQLAGHNRLEILLFRLGNDDQKYGINVFKVQEVIHCPELTHIPRSHRVVRGIADIRGKTIPIIDLAMAIEKSEETDLNNAFLIVTEYNRSIQGFIVSGVDKIVNMNWEEIKPPPKGVGNSCYLTAVTSVDEQFVEIIDVEKVLSEVVFQGTEISESLNQRYSSVKNNEKFVMIVDDSMVARNQIQRVLEQMGVAYEVAKNGREAFTMINDWLNNDQEKFSSMAMVISDVEMPEMDGYTLVTRLREDPRTAGIYIMLHTSLSGVFNSSVVEKVGANKFISKYDANLLGETVMERFRELKEQVA